MAKAIVTGLIATYPLGGVAWDYGHYVLGLQSLGYEVFYLEDTGYPTFGPTTWNGDLEDLSYPINFLKRSLSELSPGLEDRWFLRAVDGRTYGLKQEVFHQIVSEADLFLNVSGSSLLRDEYMGNRRKVLIDTDPGYNHFVNYPKWKDTQGTHGYRAHDFFFTYASKIGQSDCALPTLGLRWEPTRPVVSLDRWLPKRAGRKWTTVMSWDNYSEPIQASGRLYGAKEREFRKIETLPQLINCELEVAVAGKSTPLERLRQLGWSVVDAQNVSSTMTQYRNYIEGSAGEFSVAKNVYVETRSGWFSSRSACYLAAGKPVIVQDTGFSETLPSGVGLVTFSNLKEAAASLCAVWRNLAEHQEAARSLAESHFSAEVVLSDMLSRLGLN